MLRNSIQILTKRTALSQSLNFKMHAYYFSEFENDNQFDSSTTSEQKKRDLLGQEDAYTREERLERQADVKKAIIRSNIVSAYALSCLLHGQRFVSPFNYDDPLRGLFNKNEESLKELYEKGIDQRVRPSMITPLVGLAFSSLGLATGLLGKTVSVNTTFIIERMIESYYDECLRILNELNLEEKELRKLICEIRDSGYDKTEDFRKKYQIYDENQTLQKAKIIPNQVLQLLFDTSRKI